MPDEVSNKAKHDEIQAKETGVKRKINEVDKEKKATATSNASPYGAWVTVAVKYV